MEIMLTQMESLKKVKKLVVISTLLLTVISNSCNTRKYHKGPSTSFDSKNCIKYTLFYKEKASLISEDALLIVSGRTHVCSTKKIISGVEIKVYNSNKKELIKISSDKNGYFSFKIKPGYYSLTARTSGNTLTIPESYFGDFGNFLEMNMYLSSYPVLINELNDPTLSKEIDKLKKTPPKNKQL